MNEVSRILIVDDEMQITHVLETSLRAHAFEVRSAEDGDTAIQVFREWQPNLVITDLSMPRVGGIALCEAIRSISNVPIIVLSVKNRETSKVQALECGADDYITKPFGMDELLARVRAALRRATLSFPRSEVLELGDFHVDFSAHQVKIKDKPIYLTPKEFELLTFFLQKTGRVLTHKIILTAVWGRTYSDQPDTVRVLIRQLRKKIEPNPSAPTYLRTEPYIGYRFEPGK